MSTVKSICDVNGIRYELAGLLGRGGQGSVYAVKGGRLAVKVFHKSSHQQRERIRNQLIHVRRLPIGEMPLAKPLEMLRPPHTGYVMELLTGMAPLKRLISPQKGEKPSQEWYIRTGGLHRRLMVLGRAARILSQIHGKGLAYSDPSPVNIFISDDSSFAEVWFIDTDNLLYESAPGSLANVFTPGYGAPELVQGKSGVTTLTDAHAFAVIAFQALTLTHPFIGNLVNDGKPELEEQAFAGQLPWVDDTEDDRNFADFGISREWVLSARLTEGFQRAFGPGRLNPSERPGAAEWAQRLFAAADKTIRCPDCGGTFYFNQRQCWCRAPRPAFAVAIFQLWDPNHRAGGGILNKPHNGSEKPVIVDLAAMTSAFPFTVTRRLAFDQMGPGADEPVLELTLANNRVLVRSLNGEQYLLLSPSEGSQTVVSEQTQEIGLNPGQQSWRLHLGDKCHLHRVISFELRPGGQP